MISQELQVPINPQVISQSPWLFVASPVEFIVLTCEKWSYLSSENNGSAISQNWERNEILYPFPQLLLKNRFTLTIPIFSSHLLLIYMNACTDVENKWKIFTTIKYKLSLLSSINYHLNYVKFCINKKLFEKKKQLHDESLQIWTFRSQKAPDNWNWYSNQ